MDEVEHSGAVNDDKRIIGGVAIGYIVEGAFLQAQAQFVLHNIADADHIIAGTIGVQQTGLGGGGGVVVVVSPSTTVVVIGPMK